MSCTSVTCCCFEIKLKDTPRTARAQSIKRQRPESGISRSLVPTTSQPQLAVVNNRALPQLGPHVDYPNHYGDNYEEMQTNIVPDLHLSHNSGDLPYPPSANAQPIVPPFRLSKGIVHKENPIWKWICLGKLGNLILTCMHPYLVSILQLLVSLSLLWMLDILFWMLNELE